MNLTKYEKIILSHLLRNEIDDVEDMHDEELQKYLNTIKSILNKVTKDL